MPRRKTHEEFIEEVYGLVGGEYTVLNKYVQNKTEVKMIHNKCGHTYEVSPNSFLSKNARCPKCNIENRSKNQRKTTNQFKDEVYNLAKDEYTVLGEYKNSRTQIKMKHNNCGYVYESAPHLFTKGHRCPKCAGNLKISHESFLTKVQDKYNGGYSVVGNYMGYDEKIKIKHNICNHVFEPTPHRFLGGTKCPKCVGNIKKTHEQFVIEVRGIHGDEIIVLGNYKNNKTKILIKHNKCEHEWMSYPTNLLSGKGCPKCKRLESSEKLTVPFNEFLERFNSININNEYTYLSGYTQITKDIQVKHNECSREFSKKAVNFLNGSKCPYCYKINIMTHDIYTERLKDIQGDQYTILSDFKGYDKKIKMMHNECGYKWNVRASSLLHGCGCPICASSKGEKRVAKYLEVNNFKYETQYKIEECRYQKPLPFDFALLDTNNKLICLIEYDGEQHYIATGYWGGDKKLKRTQRNDRIKNEYCKNNNIWVMRIPYWEFDNIEEILNSELKSIM